MTAMVLAWVATVFDWSLTAPTTVIHGVKPGTSPAVTERCEIRIAEQWTYPGTEYKMIREVGSNSYNVYVNGYRVTGALSMERAAGNAQPFIDEYMRARSIN